MSESNSQSQNAVHEILSSIRQIISEDVHQELQNSILSEVKKTSPLPSAKNTETGDTAVLDLIKMVDEAGTVVNLDPPPVRENIDAIKATVDFNSLSITSQPLSTSTCQEDFSEDLSSDLREAEEQLNSPITEEIFSSSPLEQATVLADIKDFSSASPPSQKQFSVSYEFLEKPERGKNAEALPVTSLTKDNLTLPESADAQPQERPSSLSDTDNSWKLNTETFGKSMPQQTDTFVQTENMQHNKSPDTQDLLLSPNALEESAAAFAELTKATQSAFKEQPSIENVGSYTLEQLMKELLRPLLKEWLDAQLPSLVRTLVVEQIAKVLQQLNRKP